MAKSQQPATVPPPHPTPLPAFLPRRSEWLSGGRRKSRLEEDNPTLSINEIQTWLWDWWGVRWGVWWGVWGVLFIPSPSSQINDWLSSEQRAIFIFLTFSCLMCCISCTAAPPRPPTPAAPYLCTCLFAFPFKAQTLLWMRRRQCIMRYLLVSTILLHSLGNKKMHIWKF